MYKVLVADVDTVLRGLHNRFDDRPKERVLGHRHHGLKQQREIVQGS